MTNAIKSYSKKGKKYYKFQAYLGTDPITGKRKQVSRSGFNSAKVAKTELDRLQYEAEHADPFQDDQITYGEVYDMWYKAWSATVVESTQNKVLGTFKYHISPVFKDLPITKINVRFCQQFVDKISESTKSMYSLKKICSYTGAVFRHAIRLGYIQNNPMSLVIRPKKEVKQSDNYWNKEQLLRFLNVLDTDYLDQPMMRAFFHLSANTAARKSELLALQWKDINFTEHSISINKTITRALDNKQKIGKPKTANAYRTLYIDSKMVELLKDWKNQQKEILNHSEIININQFVFSTSKEKMISVMTPNHFLKNIIKKYHLKYINVHGIRHTVASLLSQSGIPVKQVQLQLGDADVSVVLNTYTHVDDALKKETTKKYSQFLSE